MATGDLYQLIDVQSQSGQQVLNVYYYKQVSEGTATNQVLALASAFESTLMGPIRDVQSIVVIHDHYQIINTDNTAEFGNVSTGEDGNIGGDVLPPFVAYSFRWNRVDRAVRNGQKRIAGVPENFQNGGVATAAAEILLDVLATLMGNNITDPTTEAIFRPQIVHRSVPGVPIYTPYNVGSVEYTRISSQNTRKFGRGA